MPSCRPRRVAVSVTVKRPLRAYLCVTEVPVTAALPSPNDHRSVTAENASVAFAEKVAAFPACTVAGFDTVPSCGGAPSKIAAATPFGVAPSWYGTTPSPSSSRPITGLFE